MSTVFVTGANGFIGAHLVPALEGCGDQVRRMVWKVGKADAIPESVAAQRDVLIAPLDDVDAGNAGGVRNVLAAIDRAEPRGAPPVLDFDPRGRENPPRNRHFGAGSAHGRHVRREEHDGIGSIWRSIGKSRASRGSPA
jgi:uncharacterized protein YbjT (DUF2867 family)